MKIAFAKLSACLERVTQDSPLSRAAYRDFEEPQLRRVEVALLCFVGAVVPGPHGGEGQKKECLFLTNEAVILLKTKDRVYERSRTKPILEGGKIGVAGVARSSRRGSVPICVAPGFSPACAALKGGATVEVGTLPAAQPPVRTLDVRVRYALTQSCSAALERQLICATW
jgi:hypothetical protein